MLAIAGKSPKRSPVPIENSEFIVELDTLIVSISESPDIASFENEGLEFTKWNTLVNDPETCQTNHPGIFAGGDLVSGPNTVVDAVASGKIAASSINQYLSGEVVKRVYTITRPSKYIEPIEFSNGEMDELASAGRPVMPVLSSEKRKYNLREVNLGLTEEQAIREAKRCLRCDLETKNGKDFIEQLAEKNKTLLECK